MIGKVKVTSHGFNPDTGVYEEKPKAKPKKQKTGTNPAVPYAGFLAECRQYGYRVPQTEYAFHPTRKWRFDFAWPGWGVAIEVDGGVWAGGRHSGGVGQIADMEKSNIAQAMGWKVYRFTPGQMRPKGNATISEAFAFITAYCERLAL